MEGAVIGQHALRRSLPFGEASPGGHRDLPGAPSPAQAPTRHRPAGRGLA